MKRIKLEFTVEWNKTFAGYSTKYVQWNWWKVQKYFVTKDDAFQSCVECFYWTRNHYRGKYENSAHFMALFKTCLSRRFARFAQLDTQMKGAEQHVIDWCVTEELPMHEMEVAWHSLSKELRQVLTMLSDAPSDVLVVLFRHASVNDMNSTIKAWCGIKTRRNVVRELRALTAR